MKGIQRLRHKLEGLLKAVDRYPVTTIFLFATAVVNMFWINSSTGDYSTFTFTFIVGALLSAVGQQLYERFFTKKSERMLFMLGAVLLAGCYYLVMHSASIFSMENGIKTAVTIFALFMAFIWVPTIKSKVTFNESFLSAFKAFFITVLFSVVIAGGISAIIFTIDHLLVNVSYNVVPHALNLVFTLFSPIFFLSFTPPFPGKKDVNQTADERTSQEEAIKKATSYPKNLSILISYIIIPLTAVYTIILLFYVLSNISGEFWTQNLLEPLLVSYAITVIFVYILASMLENKFAVMFRRIFPKVLVPIVLFQVVSSVLKIQEVGITHGRYYVILFGLFAVITGLVFSFLSIKKNGIIAAVLIILSIVSITPPIDAFTVSRVNQTNLLEKVLLENNMLEGNSIVPNATVSNEDKRIITRTVNYLNSINDIDKVAWLPANVVLFDNFQKTFGFEQMYEQQSHGGVYQYAHLDWDQNPVVNIDDMDLMIHLSTYSGSQLIPLEIGERNFQLKLQQGAKFSTVTIVDEGDREVIQFNTKELVEHILADNEGNSGNKGPSLTVEQATFNIENDEVKVSVLANSVDYYDAQYQADFYLFLKIK
ncbi:DUF4153 domain-containing protein [Sporosarcina ureilytica]|uniref:DUF4153 domain-containing protein n=1 Tax=Sporosarcina ureilytica TaxID=298596 RepID=A0A1D8JJY9_9BACL|nr:DUF4153 domain-containing protein [Sporosarcina ureilytica]